MATKSSQVQALMATTRNTTFATPTRQGLTQGNNNWASMYGTALPRTFDTFRSGDFSPMEPILPNPIDIPEAPSGRPRPRRFQFPVGWNLPVGQPGTEGIKLANFQVLRDMAEVGSIPRRAIEICKSDILNMGWQIAPTPAAEKAMQGNPKKRRDFEIRRAELSSFIFNDIDSGNYSGFYEWLNSMMEDLIVLDAVAIHVLPSRGKGSGPLGSNIGSLELIDGSSIRPLLNTWGGRPVPPQPAYQQLIWGVPRVDLMDIINLGPDATIEDLKELNPIIEELTESVDEWSGDQLLYVRQNTRAWTPYGFGPLEQCLLPVSIMMARQTWQWEFYRSGSLPSVFLDPGEMVATAEEARELQEAINMTGGDLGSRHQVIVLPPGSKVMPQKDVPHSDNFDTLMVSEVAMSFGLQISDLGLTPKIGTLQSPSQAKRDAEVALDLTVRRSALPRAHLIERIFTRLIQTQFGQSDMMFSSGVSETGEDVEELQKQWMDRLRGSVCSIDEVRTSLDMDPLGEPWSTVPLAFTSNSIMPLHAEIEMVAQMQNPNTGNTEPTSDAADPSKDQVPVVDTTPSAAGPSGPATAAHDGARSAETSIKNLEADVKKRAEMNNNTKIVYDYLRETYPKDSVEWVSGMKWKLMNNVDIEKISVTGPSTEEDIKSIKKKAKKLRKGKKMNPIVAVDPGEDGLYQVADGHHRTTAAVLADLKSIPAWVGTPKSGNKDDWRKQIMDMQIERAL